MKMSIIILYKCILALYFIYFVTADDDLASGSGSFEEEDPMKLIRKQNVEQIADKMKTMQNFKSNEDLSQNLKTEKYHAEPTKKLTKRFDRKYLPVVHRLWNYWHQKGTSDIDNENIMVETGGAKQVMHTIASKLVSHASNKITNHVGNIIKSSLVSRKSGVISNNAQSRSLSSSTEVILPALSMAKLTNNSQENQISNNTKTSESENSISNDAKASERENQISNDTKASEGLTNVTLSREEKNSNATQAADKDTSPVVQSFVKAPPIGPMETIKIQAKGASSSYSNFTKPEYTDGEAIRNTKLDFLKFEDGLTGGSSINEDVPIKKSATAETVKPKPKNIKKIQKKKKKGKKKEKRIKQAVTKKLNKIKNKKSKNENFPKIILYQGPISKALESMLNVHSTPNNHQQPEVINAPMTFEQATADIKRSRIPKSPYTAKLISNEDQESEDENSEESEEEEVDDNDFDIKKSKVSKTPKKYTVKGYPDSQINGEKKSLKNKKSKTEKGKKKFSLFKGYRKDHKSQSKDEVPILTISSSFDKNSNEDAKLATPLFGGKSYAQENQKSNLKNPNSSSPFGLPDFIKEMTFPILANSQPLNLQNKQDEGEEDGEVSQKYDEQQTPSKPVVNKINDSKVTEGLPVYNFPSLANKYSTQEANKDSKQEPKAEPFKEEPPSDKHEDDVITPVKVKESDDNEEYGDSNSSTTATNVSPLAKEDKTHVLTVDSKPIVPSVVNAPTSTPTGGISEEEERLQLMDQVDDNTHNEALLRNEIRDVESHLTELEASVNNINDEVKLLEKKMVAESHQQSANSFSTFAGPIENLELMQQPKLRPPHLTMIKKPHVLKQFFIPAPPPNSPAAKAIAMGAPVQGLPFPLNVMVSKVLQKMGKYPPNRPITLRGPIHMRFPVRNPWAPKQPQPLPEISSPPREHDIDQLELEIGKTPISRVNNLPNSFQMKKPKIIIFSKSPQFLDFNEKICDEPCANGGRCMGNNVCKCPLYFSGPKCERVLHRSSIPEDILELVGPNLNNERVEEDEAPKKSNMITLPLMVSNDEDDVENNQKTVGEVDQNKIVNILRQFTKSIPFLPDIVKRNKIPSTYKSMYEPSDSHAVQELVPRSKIIGRYGIPIEETLPKFSESLRQFNYPRIESYRKR